MGGNAALTRYVEMSSSGNWANRTFTWISTEAPQVSTGTTLCVPRSGYMGTGPCSCQLVSCTSTVWQGGCRPAGSIAWAGRVEPNRPASANGSCFRVTRDLRRDRAAEIKSEARQ